MVAKKFTRILSTLRHGCSCPPLLIASKRTGASSQNVGQIGFFAVKLTTQSRVLPRIVWVMVKLWVKNATFCNLLVVVKVG